MKYMDTCCVSGSVFLCNHLITINQQVLTQCLKGKVCVNGLLFHLFTYMEMQILEYYGLISPLVGICMNLLVCIIKKYTY